MPTPGRWSKAAKFPPGADGQGTPQPVDLRDDPGLTPRDVRAAGGSGLRKTAAAYVTPDMVSVDDDGQTWVNVPVYVWVFRTGLCTTPRTSFPGACAEQVWPADEDSRAVPGRTHAPRDDRRQARKSPVP